MDEVTSTAQAAAENTAAQTGADAAGKTAQTAAVSAETAKEPEKAAGQQQEPVQPDSDYVKQLRAGFEKEKEEAVKAAVEEAAKKAAMKPEEVKEYEGRKREEELEKREKELQLRELKNDARDILHEKGIPAGFAEFLISDGMEKTKENIDAFKKEFDLAVQAQVEQRLKGTTPKAGSGTGGAGGMSAEIDKYL